MLAWLSPEVPSVGPRNGVPVRVHASASRSLREVGNGRRASVYVCGITPYDSTHLGHANTYVAFDLLVRQWLDAGAEVTYTQNVTDVDDPLLERARETGVDWRDLAADQIDLFRGDMEALRVIAPTHFVGAVESVPDVVRAVQRMLADGSAYRVGPDADGQGEGDVYAALARDSVFGEVSLDPAAQSPQARAAQFAERGGDPDRPGKRDPLDPLLWRRERAGEPSWDGDDLGAGRPGWHIECATIAAMTLGVPIDVQGGGSDLQFPHHEMSLSHLRMLTGTPHPVRADVHGGLVGFEGHKMSKSRGNLVLVSRLREAGADPMAIRLVILAHHYRQAWEYVPEELAAAGLRLDRWRAAVALGRTPVAEGVVEEMRAALADDLDAPRALAAMDEWAQQALAAPGGHEGVSEAFSAAQVRAAVDALLGIEL